MARVGPILNFWMQGRSEGQISIGAGPTNGCAALLSLGTHLRLATLFTEKRIMPLRFRRAKPAIGYLIYLLQLPHWHYAYAGLQESSSLLLAGLPCWIGELNWVFAHLPGWRLKNIHVDYLLLAHCSTIVTVLWVKSYIYLIKSLEVVFAVSALSKCRPTAVKLLWDYFFLRCSRSIH